MITGTCEDMERVLQELVSYLANTPHHNVMEVAAARKVLAARATPANGKQVERVAAVIEASLARHGVGPLEIQGTLDDAQDILATLSTPTEDARSRVKVLEEALLAILDGDVPRPVARQWRADGKPSKLDQCKHDVSVSEDCAGCTAEFVTTALGNKETDRHG